MRDPRRHIGEGRSRRRDGRAFTLVELLVTIAIIAILISLLVPALKGARDAARDADCLARHRSIGAILLIYRQDNDDLLPYAKASSDMGITPEKVAGYAALAESLDVPAARTDPDLPGAIPAAHIVHDAFRCPFDVEAAASESNWGKMIGFDSRRTWASQFLSSWRFWYESALHTMEVGGTEPGGALRRVTLLTDEFPDVPIWLPVVPWHRVRESPQTSNQEAIHGGANGLWPDGSVSRLDGTDLARHRDRWNAAVGSGRP